MSGEDVFDEAVMSANVARLANASHLLLEAITTQSPDVRRLAKEYLDVADSLPSGAPALLSLSRTTILARSILQLHGGG